MSGERQDSYWVGFDLGGTKMLAVLFDQQFQPIARQRKRTDGQAGPEAGVKRIIGVIQALLGEAHVAPQQVRGIGIGCPGPLDLDRGIVLEMPNLGWKKVRLEATLQAAFGCPTVLANDVDAGVYGEYRFGAAREARCVVGVFPGTGIGGGAVYQGNILRGQRGSCLEIGHIPVLRNGPLCGCGRRGCLEAVAGRLAIAAEVSKAAFRGEAPYVTQKVGCDVAAIRSQVLADAIEAGDKAVESIVRDAARMIGWATAGVVNVLAPDIVLLGGGLVEDMPKLFHGEIEAALRAQVMPSFTETFEVAVAKLSGDASVLGAAAWAQHVLAEESQFPPQKQPQKQKTKGKA
jgi:glucokinase